MGFSLNTETNLGMSVRVFPENFEEKKKAQS